MDKFWLCFGSNKEDESVGFWKWQWRVPRLCVYSRVYSVDEEWKHAKCSIYMDTVYWGASWLKTNLPSIVYPRQRRKRHFWKDNPALHSKHCGGASLFWQEIILSYTQLYKRNTSRGATFDWRKVKRCAGRVHSVTLLLRKLSWKTSVCISTGAQHLTEVKCCA